MIDRYTRKEGGVEQKWQTDIIVMYTAQSALEPLGQYAPYSINVYFVISACSTEYLPYKKRIYSIEEEAFRNISPKSAQYNINLTELGGYKNIRESLLDTASLYRERGHKGMNEYVRHKISSITLLLVWPLGSGSNFG